MKRSAAVVLVTAMTLGSLPPSEASRSSADVEPTADFHPIACPDGAFPEDRAVDCGYVEVPENRAEPDGRMIKVAAAVVHATDPTPEADPIVFVNGGPSVGTIQPFALEAYFSGAPYADDHDLILVDTRGTGISHPRLGCPEVDRADAPAWYSGSFIYDRAPEITGRALDECWARLVGRGIDLSSYNSAESAADLEALRLALGVDRWNLFALSADGTLGLTYMRRFPDGIRSAVIDSGISSNAQYGLDFLRGETDLVNSAFVGCEANRQCQAAYPGLRRDFYRMVRRLNRHPVRVTLPAFRPEPVVLLLDGASLVADFNWGFWPGAPGVGGSHHQVLREAWQISRGKYVKVYRRLYGTGPVTNEHDDRFTALGKTMSYVCHDFVRFITFADRRRAAEADPAHARRILGRQYDLGQGWNFVMSPEGCRHWPVGKAGPRQHKVVTSDIPSLVFSGTFDSAVAPRTVERMLPGLSRSTYVEMPASSHIILGSFTRGNRCARQVTAAFLVAPEEAPDTSCVDDVRQLDFTPPDRSRQLSTTAEWRRAAPAWLPGSCVTRRPRCPSWR